MELDIYTKIRLDTMESTITTITQNILYVNIKYIFIYNYSKIIWYNIFILFIFVFIILIIMTIVYPVSKTHILITRYKETDMSIVLKPFINRCV